MKKVVKRKDLYGEATVEVRLHQVPQGLGMRTKVIHEVIDSAMERLNVALHVLAPHRDKDDRRVMKLMKPTGHQEDDLMDLTMQTTVVFNDQVDAIAASRIIKQFNDELAELVIGYIRQAKVDAREPLTAQLRVLAAASISA